MQFSLSPIEDALAANPGNEKIQAMFNELESDIVSLKRKANVRLSPQERQRAEKFILALEAAQELMVKVVMNNSQ